MLSVGINGFGRIGRTVLRAATRRSDVRVVAVNDLLPVDHLAYLLRYDSVHGRYPDTIDTVDGHLVIDGRTVRVTAEADPADLRWGDVGADVVIESTGRFLDQQKAAAHLDAGTRAVIM